VKTNYAIVRHLRAIPYHKEKAYIPQSVFTVMAETIPFLLNSLKITAGLLYPYPSEFEPILFESKDGTPICCLVATKKEPAPALIIVHGFFSCKNSLLIQDLAFKAFYEWGFHVLVLDLRGCGESARFSNAPMSFGYRESDDILQAALILDSNELVTGVGVIGFGTGGASALLATSRSGVQGPIAGGVMSVCTFSSARRALDSFSRLSGKELPPITLRLVLKLMLGIKTAFSGPKPLFDFEKYVREVTAQYYEIEEDELLMKSSPINSIRRIEVPCILVHSQNDQVIPVKDALEIESEARDNPMVEVLVIPDGGHTLHQIRCKDWFYRIVKAFFTYWGEFAKESINKNSVK
jgi:pimeloyl-ACP methyl ester carboxylesterase